MTRALPFVLAAGASLLACAPAPSLDHLWAYDRCAVAFESPIAWDANVPSVKPRATALLRRQGGASAVVLQLSTTGDIGDPYPSPPTLRLEVPPGAVGPTDLRVVPDTSDVRGPAVVGPGTAWLIQTDHASTFQPGDGWNFGSGTMHLASLTIAETDTSSRDSASLDAALDLSGVTVAPMGGATAESPAKPVGGLLRIRCVDEGTPSLDQGAGGAGPGGPGGAGGMPDTSGMGGGGTAAMGGTGGAAAGGEGGSGGAAAACGANPCPTPMQVGTGIARAVAASDAGIAWISAMPDGVLFAPPGGAPTTLASGGMFSAVDAIRMDSTAVFWASYGGISTAILPSGPAQGLTGGSQPDSVRLLGITQQYVYYLTLAEGNAYDVVRRIPRAGSSQSELVACLPLNSTYDATLEPTSGAVLVSDGQHVTRHDGVVGGASCGANTAGTTLATAGQSEGFVAVLAGPTTAALFVEGAAGNEIRAVPIGGGSPVILGAAATFATTQILHPFAMSADTVFWVDAAPVGASQHRIVTSTSPGSVEGVAMTQDSVTALAADASKIVWSDQAGIFFVPR